MEVKAVDKCGTAYTAGRMFLTFSNGDPLLPLVHTGNGNWAGTWTPARGGLNTPVAVKATAINAESERVIYGGEAILNGVLGRGASVPTIAPGAIQNGASFSTDATVAPGTWISIKGVGLAERTELSAKAPLETTLGGAQVVLADKELPLIFASDGQINAQVPFDLPLNTDHQIWVKRGSAVSVPSSITITSAQPAVFTSDQTGRGQGVAVEAVSQRIADLTAPVREGQTIIIYCTGLGAVSPPVSAGVPAPGASRTTSPVTVTIGGRPAQVPYAGMSPGSIGLYQINTVIPAGVAAGDAVPVMIEVAGQRSPPVTIAVR